MRGPAPGWVRTGTREILLAEGPVTRPEGVAPIRAVVIGLGWDPASWPEFAPRPSPRYFEIISTRRFLSRGIIHPFSIHRWWQPTARPKASSGRAAGIVRCRRPPPSACNRPVIDDLMTFLSSKSFQVRGDHFLCGCISYPRSHLPRPRRLLRPCARSWLLLEPKLDGDFP